MRTMLLAGLALALLVPGGVRAQPVQTIELLRVLCDPPAAQCDSFIAGIAAAMEMVGLTELGPARNKLGICPVGAELATGPLRQIFLDWSDANPADRQLPAVVGVMSALRDAFPCRHGGEGFGGPG